MALVLKKRALLFRLTEDVLEEAIQHVAPTLSLYRILYKTPLVIIGARIERNEIQETRSPLSNTVEIIITFKFLWVTIMLISS